MWSYQGTMAMVEIAVGCGWKVCGWKIGVEGMLGFIPLSQVWEADSYPQAMGWKDAGLSWQLDVDVSDILDKVLGKSAAKTSGIG